MTVQAEAQEFIREGFIPRQLADIQQEINDRLLQIVDPVTGEQVFQNNSDDTILQQIVAIFAEAGMSADNAAAWAFLMRDPLSAVGKALSALVQLNGITRNAGSRTIIPLMFEGVPGTLIPRGSIFTDDTGTQRYALNEDVVIPLSGTSAMGASCTEYGPYNPRIGSIVVSRQTIIGLTSVTNGQTSSIGKDEETDEQLRARQQQSTSATSYRQIEAIRGAVLDTEGVTFCRAYQNSGLTVSENGISPKSVAVVAVGGDDRKICENIFLRAPLGIWYDGDIMEVFFDNQNISYPIRFSRPTEIEIYVRIVLEVITDEGINIFPSNGTQLIKDAIVYFAEYGSSACEPIGNPGFPPGQDIIVTQLYTPINSVGGARIISVEISTDGENYQSTDLTIMWNEIGLFDQDRIEITYR